MRRTVITDNKQGIMILARIMLAMIEGKEGDKEKIKEILSELSKHGYITIREEEIDGNGD